MKKVIFIILTSLFHYSGVAQRSSHAGKLPWVKNNMPKLQGVTSKYQTVFTVSPKLNDAFKKNENRLISTVSAKRGQHFSSEQLIKSNKKYQLNQTTNNGNTTYSRTDIISKDIARTIKVKGTDFRMSYIPIDQYYEYKNGSYHLWVLYLVAEDEASLGEVPSLVYKLDKGAWRSVIFPGWAQLYQGRTAKGLLLIVGEGALVSAGLYFNNEYTTNNKHFQEATSAKTKQYYRDRANKNQTYSYVAFGAAAAWYVYNIVDAFTSKKGKISYDYKRMQFALYPTVNHNILTNEPQLMATIQIHF